MFLKITRVLLEDPLKPFSRFLGVVYVRASGLRSRIQIGSRLKVDGIPLLDIRSGAQLEIGNNVTLTSRNRGYHLNLHSSVKLFADQKGAVISIGNDTRIHGTCIHARKEIVIGQRCLIAANCQIIDSNGHDICFSNVEERTKTKGIARSVIIEDDVWLGTGVIVLPGVRIGKGSVVGAGSVVSRSIPPGSVAVGVPARVVKRDESL